MSDQEKLSNMLHGNISPIQYEVLLRDMAELRQSHIRVLEWIISLNAGMNTMAQQELDRFKD